MVLSTFSMLSEFCKTFHKEQRSQTAAPNSNHREARGAAKHDKTAARLHSWPSRLLKQPRITQAYGAQAPVGADRFEVACRTHASTGCEECRFGGCNALRSERTPEMHAYLTALRDAPGGQRLPSYHSSVPSRFDQSHFRRRALASDSAARAPLFASAVLSRRVLLCALQPSCCRTAENGARCGVNKQVCAMSLPRSPTHGSDVIDGPRCRQGKHLPDSAHHLLATLGVSANRIICSEPNRTTEGCGSRLRRRQP